MTSLPDVQREAIEAAMAWPGPLAEALKKAVEFAKAHIAGRIDRAGFGLRWNRFVIPLLEQVQIKPHLRDFLPLGTMESAARIREEIEGLRLYARQEGAEIAQVVARETETGKAIEALDRTLRAAFDRLLRPQQGRVGLLHRHWRAILVVAVVVSLLLIAGPPALVGIAEKYLGLGDTLKPWCGVDTYYEACGTGCLWQFGCAILRPPRPATPIPSATLALTATLPPIITSPPSATPSPTPTWTPCDSRDDPSLPCVWTILTGDSFFTIARDVYTNLRFELILTNLNRGDDGYRLFLRPGLEVFLPDPEDVPPIPYAQCPTENEDRASFPCLYHAVAGDNYNSLASRYYVAPSFWRCIASANFVFQGFQLAKLTTDRYEDVGGNTLIVPVQRIPCPN